MAQKEFPLELAREKSCYNVHKKGGNSAGASPSLTFSDYHFLTNWRSLHSAGFAVHLDCDVELHIAANYAIPPCFVHVLSNVHVWLQFKNRFFVAMVTVFP